MIGASLCSNGGWRERELSERELGEEEKDEENGVLGFRDVFISCGLKISGFIVQLHKI